MLTYRSKKDYVYETLRGKILSNALEPGTRLIIDDLASELGVSPIPVREALHQLQADGYVVIQPYVGARVAEIHVESIHEIFALLEAMEVISGRAACEQMTDEDLETLRATIARMEELVDDPEAWTRENLALHQFICARAGTFLVGALLQKAQEHWDRLRRYYFADVFTHRVKESQKEHLEILEALTSRDPERIEESIRAHNRRALRAYVTYLSNDEFEVKALEPA